jgi:CheY-like chemotaxis protein
MTLDSDGELQSAKLSRRLLEHLELLKLLVIKAVEVTRSRTTENSMSPKQAVLVVEDEVLIRMDLVSTLEHAGYATFEASSATEAIAIVERHPEIRVVFTDVQMPGKMDGLELARYVRKRWPPTIIVIASGKVAPQPDEMPDDVSFLAKPYEEAKLSKILADVADRLAT